MPYTQQKRWMKLFRLLCQYVGTLTIHQEKEIFLLKLGEIVLKGANKRQFEDKLRQNVRRRMKHYGNFDVYLMQSTIYVEPMDELADVDGAWEACHTIFGVVSLCRCRPCEKNLDAIFEAIENYLGDDLDCAKSFKVESKRSDKRFPMTSIQISQEIGGRLAEAHPTCAVDVHHPEYTVFVEEYGPKYSDPSGTRFLVIVILGHSDFISILISSSESISCLVSEAVSTPFSIAQTATVRYIAPVSIY